MDFTIFWVDNTRKEIVLLIDFKLEGKPFIQLNNIRQKIKKFTKMKCGIDMW